MKTIKILAMLVVFLFSVSCDKEPMYKLTIDVPALAFNKQGTPDWLPGQIGSQPYSPTNVIHVLADTDHWKAISSEPWATVTQLPDRVIIEIDSEGIVNFPQVTFITFKIQNKLYATCEIYLIEGGDEVFTLTF